MGVRRYSHNILLKTLKNDLLDLKFDEDLFQNLLFSIPEQLRHVQEATEGNPNFKPFEFIDLIEVASGFMAITFQP